MLDAVAATAMPGTGAEDWRFAIEGETYKARADYPYAHTVTVTAGFFDALHRPDSAGARVQRIRHAAEPARCRRERSVRSKSISPTRTPSAGGSAQAEDPNATPLTIVGVAPNINHDKGWKEGGFAPTIYRPVTQLPWRFMTVAVRTAGEPHAYGNLLVNATQKLDPDIAPYWIKTLDEFQTQKRETLRLLSNVFTGFALIAIILAAVGIYGVLAFATGQRNREIGVRRALGRTDRQILGTIMQGALFQIAVGLALGALFAPLMGRALKNSLSGLTSADDPVVYLIVLGVLLVASVLASWIPVRRGVEGAAFVGASMRVKSGSLNRRAADESFSQPPGD